MFAARRDGFTAAYTGSATTDGQHTGQHGVITIIDEFKNRPTGNSAIPEIEIVRYFAQGKEILQKRADRWKVPGLGIAIVGL